MCKDTTELFELTNKLQEVSLEDFICRSGGRADFDFDSGTATTVSLLFKEGIAVAEGSMSKGTIVPLHKHKGSKEFFIVYEGAMTITCENGDRHELGVGSTCVIDKNNLHTVNVTENCRFITITIPADPIFPR